MRELTLHRNNEYVSAINTIRVKVNGDQYNLDRNSIVKIELEKECDEIEVEVNYLFFWRKYLYKSSSSDMDITIKPTVSNRTLILALTILFSLLLLSVFSGYEWARFLFRIYGISILMVFFFITTVGGKYFYSASFR